MLLPSTCVCLQQDHHSVDWDHQNGSFLRTFDKIGTLMLEHIQNVLSETVAAPVPTLRKYLHHVFSVRGITKNDRRFLPLFSTVSTTKIALLVDNTLVIEDCAKAALDFNTRTFT